MRRIYLGIILWGLTGPGITLVIFLMFPGQVEKVELQTSDIRVMLKGPSGADDRMVLIIIDDPSITRLGTWPWPRSLHGEIIRSLDALGAKVIVYDILFATPWKDPSQDQALAQAMRDTNKVVFPLPLELKPCPPGSELTDLKPESWLALEPFFMEIEPDSTRIHPPCATRARLPLLDMIGAASGLGHNASTPDADGVFRRVPILANVRDRVIPAMGLSAVARLGRWEFNKMRWVENELVIPPASKQDTSALHIPLDKDANILINWTGEFDSITSFSARWLLEPAPPQEIKQEIAKQIKGAVCVVGAGFTGGSDIGPQPFQMEYPLVGLHANLISTILSREFLTQTGRGSVIICVLLLSIAAIALGFIPRPWISFTAGILIIIAYFILSCAALIIWNTFIPVVAPELSFIIGFAAVTAYRLSRESENVRFLREHLGHIMPPALLDQLIDNPDYINLQSERRELTMLFSDIVGFTSISDREEPEVVYNMLTEYFEAMARIIFKHGGTIDKFMGDGILAFWGAPVPSEESALQAVRAAVDMQGEVRALSAKWESEGFTSISIRIGVNTGYVHVGFFGSRLRREYTVLGSNVNLAQRLEGACTPGNVLISRRTHRLIKDEFQARSLGEINLKGFADQVEVYEIDCAGQ
jgi:adenylate cyclase